MRNDTQNRLELCQSCPALSVDRCTRTNRQAKMMALKDEAGPAGCPWPGSPDALPPPASTIDPLRHHVPQAPERKVEKIAALTCFFNPVGYQNLIRNYHKFSESLGAHQIDLHTIELSLGRGFDLPEDSKTIRVEADPHRSTLWQKERLLNLAFEQLPDKYDAIAWIDADVIFQRVDLVDGIKQALEKHQWAQMFSGSWYTDQAGCLDVGKRSSGWYWKHEPQRVLKFLHSHPGFAWVARREFLEATGGLYQFNVTGGGDITMMQGVTDRSGHCHEDGFGQWREIVERWAVKARAAGGGSFSYVPGDLIHLFHGTKENRQYNQRFSWLLKHRFDPDTDIELTDSGVLQWSDYAMGSKREMVELVRNYFKTRREDG